MVISPPVDDPWATRFPRLFAQARVDYANCDLGFTTGPVPETLVSRLHLVAATPHGTVVVCRSIQGWRFLPGGTREPGETLAELARRELWEEAGARVTGGIELFAAHVADSREAGPYRPHLPHPRAYWAYAVTRAEVVGPPANPADGEQVIEVRALPPAEAAAYIEVHDPMHADVVRLARAMRLI